jgi:hypothetical protein
LAAQLAATRKPLSEGKASQSAAARCLAEEKVVRQTAEWSLLTSDEARANLAQDLESVQASLTATTSMLASKSFALDTMVIQEHEMEIKLKKVEEKLKAAEKKMKSQGQLLDSTQQALSKWEFLSSAVANAMALMKNHMPKFDAKILQKDFTVDDMERAMLVNSAYDTAHHFVSLYDFSVLADSDDNNSPRAL